MQRVQKGTIGILPAGALGVAFFYHLTGELMRDDGRVFFVERADSRSAEALRSAGELKIVAGEALHRVAAVTVLRGNLDSLWERGELPEVLLLCPNPDQLLPVLQDVVALLEKMSAAGRWGAEPALPALVLSSNGIYFQRLRQQFIERLEESTLLGRLPDLWPDLMPRIVGKLLRGVTIQTGLRDGSGAGAVYQPGPRGITRLAGGDERVRRRTCELLRERGAWVELARDSSATRLEFDKAMVNLSSNLLGQIYAIDAGGRFLPLRVREIVTPEREPELRTLMHHVFDVGVAVKAYSANEDFDALFAHVLHTNHEHGEHIPSSLQWLGLRLRQGMLEPKLTPTEEWLLEPLIRYAHAAGLHEAGRFFEELKERALASLKRAACLPSR
jgi:hypothetical protein